MIVKRESYDSNGALTTRWTAGVVSAVRSFSQDWQSDVLAMRFVDDHPQEQIVLEQGEGVYLCNDEGKTIEVLSRLAKPKS